MNYTFFNWDEVVEAMEIDGYYIHTYTNPKGREEASLICDNLSEYFNVPEYIDIDNNLDDEDNKIYFINSEVPPACNYGIIRRSDIFEYNPIQNIDDIKLIKLELEKQRIKKHL